MATFCGRWRMSAAARFRGPTPAARVRVRELSGGAQGTVPWAWCCPHEWVIPACVHGWVAELGQLGGAGAAAWPNRPNTPRSHPSCSQSQSLLQSCPFSNPAHPLDLQWGRRRARWACCWRRAAHMQPGSSCPWSRCGVCWVGWLEHGFIFRMFGVWKRQLQLAAAAAGARGLVVQSLAGPDG